MPQRIEFKSEAGRNIIFNIFLELGISELDFCDDFDQIKKRLYPVSSNKSLGFIICKALHYQIERKNVQLLQRTIDGDKLMYIKLFKDYALECVDIIPELPLLTTSDREIDQNKRTLCVSLANQDSSNFKNLLASSKRNTKAHSTTDWVEMESKMEFSEVEWRRIWIEDKGSFVPYKTPSIFAEKLQHIENCGCIFAAKGNDVEGDKIIMRGYCTQTNCRAYKFIMEKSMLKTNIKIFKIFHSKMPTNHPDELAKQCRGFVRTDMKEDLKTMNPKRLWLKKASNINSEIRENENNVQVPSYTSVRKMNSERLAADDLHSDPLIDMIMECNKQAGTADAYLRKIQVCPLAITIYSKLQTKVLKEVLKRIGPEEELIAHTDATGGLFRQPKNVVNRIFYYALIITFKNNKTDRDRTSFPISELITSSHNVDSINSWLSSTRLFLEDEITNFKWPYFQRIITDKSFANLNALNIAFNRMTLSEYLNLSYNHLTKNVEIENKVKIHLCCCHVMKIISDDIKAHIDKEYAGFIIEVFASIFNTDSLDDIKYIWKMLTIILNTEYLNDSVKKAIKDLTNMILNISKNHDTIEDLVEDEDDLIENEFDDHKVLYKSSPFFVMFQNISNGVMFDTTDSEIRNRYFSEHLLNVLLKKHMSFIPLWSGLLNEPGRRYSNAYIESYFGVLKLEKEANSMLYGFNQQKLMRFIRRLRDRTVDTSKVFMLRVPKTRNCSKNKKMFSVSDPDDTEITIKQSMEKEETWNKTTKSSIGYFNMKKIKQTQQRNAIMIQENEDSKDKINSNGLDKNLQRYFILYKWILAKFPLEKENSYETLIFSDFWTLNDKCDLITDRYLSNFLVDYFLIILTANNKEFEALPEYKVDGIMFQEKYFYEIKFTKKFCFLPILTKNRRTMVGIHFMLAIINTEEKKFIFLDPGNDDDNNEQTYFKQFLKVVEINPTLGKTIEWSIKKIKHKKQSDQYNCGVFCLYYAEEYIKYKALKNTKPFDPEKHRDHIKKTILETSTDMTERCQICGLLEQDTENEQYSNWAQCPTCERWVHFWCLKRNVTNQDNYECLMCE